MHDTLLISLVVIGLVSARVGEFSFMFGGLRKSLRSMSDGADVSMLAAALRSIVLNPFVFRFSAGKRTSLPTPALR